jgi:hypothetical protein
MLKNRIVVMSLVLTLLAVLAPVPSQAAPRGWNAASGPAAAGFFLKIERWWSRLLNGQELNGQERPAPAPEQRKNGCGIDPNGQPLCGTGTGPGGGGGAGNATAGGDPAGLG